MCKQHATLNRAFNPQFKNSNRDRRIHSRLVRRHVREPDKERVANGLPYLEILKGWLKVVKGLQEVPTHKMAH